MENTVQKKLITEHRIRTLRNRHSPVAAASLQLLVFVFCSLTAYADPLDTTYRQTFHLSPLFHPNIIPGHINNVFDFRERLLSLTDGVMPTNVKLGTSFGVAPLRSTQGAYYDYIFQQISIKNTFEAAFISDTPLGIHINATPWGDLSDQTTDNLYNFLEKYDDGIFIQKDRFGRIRRNSMSQTPYAEEYLPSGFSMLEMQLTLSRYATPVQDYFRRNNRMVARHHKWYREQHPDIIVFASMSSEYQQNNHPNYEYCDYCDSTKLEFRDWLSGNGLYVGKGQYASLADFNSDFGFSYTSWSVINPPVAVNWTEGSYWKKWDEFRVAQVRNIEQEQVNWTIDGGLTPDQVYGHQTPFNPETASDSERKHAGYWTTTFVEEGGNGVTTYTESSWDTNLFSALRANDKNWGIFEYNPKQSTVSGNLSALEAVWDYDAHINCPFSWSGEPPLGIAGTVFESAIQQFIYNHFTDSYSGLKSYETDPSGNDVIWTMSYESDVEGFADFSLLEFTNGIMSATVNGSAPNVSFEIDESKHYIKSDNYYAASFRIFTTNSAGRTGKFLWHENGGGNQEVEFPLKDGWNVYKINLIESASWRGKNIDNLNLFFNAANGSKVKLDWFRLEANHCWNFDDTGEIYGQNELSDETFSGSSFSASTVGDDNYFYFSTDKHELWQNADRAFIDADFYKKIRVKMTCSISGTGQIYWWLRDGTFDFKNFDVQSGTHTYEIDMTDKLNWTGSIVIFRIDPINQTGADFSIDYVNVSPELLPPRIANSDLTVNSPLPVFLWEEPIEPDYSGLTYSLELATDFDFTNIVYSSENLSGGTNIYNGNSLLDGLHWWRIRAEDNSGTVSPWAVPMPMFIRVWNFDRAEDIYYAHDFSTPIVANNIWSASRVGYDPYVCFNVGNDRGVNADLYTRFCCSLKTDNELSHAASLFFFNCGDGYKNVVFSNPHNGEWQYKDIDLSSNPDWNGYAWYTRISPVLNSGNTAYFKSIYFLPADAHNVEIVDTNLPGGKISVPYSHSLSTTGAIGQTKWAHISGTLPVGLTLGTDGVLNGTPTTVAFNTFTVSAEDEVFRSATKEVTIEIVPEIRMVIGNLLSVIGIFFAVSRASKRG